jgi:tetratricopeptide (TPR) repeat protein
MVDELKYIVDHPLSDTEMEWARKNVTASRSGFDKVFSSIRYDIPRYEKNVLTWPYANYTLAEIRQRGGICVDQAYFAAMSGKAKGLPTLFFTGQGDSGGHAWFGYLETPGRWETDCGRYAQQNYPVGQAMDPQTWKPMSDTDLIFLAKNRERSPSFQQARLWTAYAESLGVEEAERWIEAALDIQPEYLPAWILQSNLLMKKNADLESRKEFWNSFVKRFAPYADLKVLGQEKLLDLAKTSGDVKGIANLERQILVQNRAKRFDLGIGAAAGQVSEKIQEGNWDGAQTSFRQALREYKGQAGGHLFYGLVAPFVEAAVAEGQAQVARAALLEARRVLKPTPDTLVGRSFVLLEAKVDDGGRVK